MSDPNSDALTPMHEKAASNLLALSLDELASKVEAGFVPIVTYRIAMSANKQQIEVFLRAGIPWTRKAANSLAFAAKGGTNPQGRSVNVDAIIDKLQEQTADLKRWMEEPDA